MNVVTVQGERVPALGFGTFQLRDDACEVGVRHALEIGYRHFDTAQAYGNEDRVGKAMKAAGIERGEIFLTTKLWRESLHADDVRSTAEASLKQLRTEYVDLLLIHWPNAEVSLAETLGAMRSLQDAGKVRFIGVSNFTPTLMREARRHAKIFANQVEYHPFLAQNKLLEMAREQDFMLTAYSPLARGAVMDNESLVAIGQAHGKSPAQVALRWLLQQEKVCVIPKAATAEHRTANFDLFDFFLSEKEMAAIFKLDENRRFIAPAFSPKWER